jgi:putative Mn2+ efflux pump MntP
VSLWSVILLAAAVSADAVAASLAIGVRTARLTGRTVVTVAGIFAVCQVLMPLLGWAMASSFAEVLAPVDHWISFVLLGLLGAGMTREALGPDRTDDRADDGPRLTGLLLLGLATSIDAAAVGVTLAMMSVDIVQAVAVIGAVTFAAAAAAVVVGHRAGLRFRRPAEILGGIVLIAVGTRILCDHLGIW